MAAGSGSFNGYCFPQIAAATGGRPRPSERSECDFHRRTLGRADGCAAALSTAEPTPPSPEQIEQEAYCRGFRDGERSGYEKGERAGLEAADRELEGLKRSLLGQMGELEALRERLTRQIEGELLDLVLAVARKVTQQELAMRPEAVSAVLNQVLAGLAHAVRVTVHLNPEDLKRLERIAPPPTDGPSAAFVPDPAITPGGFRVETDLGEVDARIERRFQAVEEAFRRELNAPAAAGGEGEGRGPGD